MPCPSVSEFGKLKQASEVRMRKGLDRSKHQLDTPNAVRIRSNSRRSSKELLVMLERSLTYHLILGTVVHSQDFRPVIPAACMALEGGVQLESIHGCFRYPGVPEVTIERIRVSLHLLSFDMQADNYRHWRETLINIKSISNWV
ncbi:hypothetical protein SynBIOSU31_50008 [Synechococcus sp. BIOS-U3-1]|nr:hypothetical protein SynBIOSU31_50008 [Synechococcus sp. BIOS-U3-1]